MRYVNPMKWFKYILISLSLMSLLGCSSAPTLEPEIRIVTKIEQAIPPEGLMQHCTPPTYRPIQVTKDIVDSRQDWISSWAECDARYERLIEWNRGKNRQALNNSSNIPLAD